MAKKIKLSEAAKDMKLSSKELAAFFEEHNKGKKNSSSSVTKEEMNLALEFYSQKSNVESFDAYFATKNDPRPVRVKEEKKPARKKTEKPAGQPAAEPAAEPAAVQEPSAPETKPAPEEARKGTCIQGGCAGS